MGALAVGLSNPFPGLRPFNEDEEYLFFGRENEVDTMVDKLARTRFLAVLGSSGSGKSSLVNCGLRPALHRGLMGGAGSAWRIAQFRPGSAPLEAMAKALAKDSVLFPGFKLQGLTLDELIESTLRLSKLGLIDIYEQARLNDGANLLVVVDQFEELFRYRALATPQKTDEYGMRQETTAFVNLLLEAAKQRTCPIYVVLTMRSDFLGDCAQFPALPEAINEGYYLVPRMTRDERRAAIGGPVAVRGAEISPVLLTRLVNDVGDDPDQLSILQHALNRTWAKWEEQGRIGPLDLKHYEAIGTMASALDKHVEEAFAELADERKRKICEKLFKALTDKSTDARGIRRPTKLGTVCALCGTDEPGVKEVIDVFREPQRSFLMPPASEELADNTVIDISHESLMRLWERLRLWAEEEVQSARLYRRLAETAVLEKTGKARLWSDLDLQLALDWKEEENPTATWASPYGGNFESAIAFLERSRHRRDHELAEAVFERRWRNRWRLIIVMLLAGFFLWRFVAGDFDRLSETFGFRRSEVKQSLEAAADELRKPTTESLDNLLRNANNTGAGLLTFICFFGPYYVGYFALTYSGKWIYRRVAFAGILKEVMASTNKAVREERLAKKAVGDAALALKTTYASFARRFVAYILDFGIFLAGVLVICFGAGFFGVADDVARGAAAFIITQFVLWWLYKAIMISSRQQATVGLMATGIFVADQKGDRLNFGVATARHFAILLSYVTLGIGFYIQPFTPRRQALHDLIAKSVVLVRPEKQQVSRRMVVHCVIVGLPLIILVLTIALVGLLHEYRLSTGRY